MLPAGNRLRSTRDFARIHREGRSLAHPLLILRVLASPGNQRLGIVASKKVGGAVVRNRVRRRIRELVRQRLPHWYSEFDVVLIVRPAAAVAEFAELAAALDQLANRARLTPRPGSTPIGIPPNAPTDRPAELAQ